MTKMTRLLFDGLDKRVALDRDDSDFAYFHALSLKLEYVTKVAAAGLLACVQDDIDRYRYSFEHTLVRADGIGAWAAVINRVFTGPAARHIDSSASRVKSDLSERVGPGDWRYASIEALSRATSSIGGPDGIARKEPLRRFFEIGAILRNRSRGHGAPTQRQCSAACPHLYFALDAVETIENPGDVYRWIDTHVRLPNKVLITTRHRDFAADYPIEIGGMTEDQANDLIGRHATRLGIERLMSSTYQTDLIRETDGHPYVIVVLLGEVAKRRKAVKPKRIVAGAEHILDALFERTYEALSPLAKRVFLLLSSWRVSVPEIAIEMVLLRPDNDERFDVKRAIEELSQFSFIDWIDSEEERLASVYVPLAAAMYGKRKLDVSPLKAPVEEDRRLLMEFGPGRGTAVGQRVLPRVENLFRRVREQLSGDLVQYEERREMLEYLGMRLPRAFLLLADVAVDVGESERAKEYVRRYLEGVAKADRLEGWEKLADICRLTEDYDGEMHALGEAAALSDNEEWEMGRMANRLNQLIDHVKKKRKMDTRSVEVRRTVKGVIRVMESRLSELSATNCSRLAWLHLNVGNEDRAVDVARLGIGRDPDNEHCVRLMRRLDV